MICNGDQLPMEGGEVGSNSYRFWHVTKWEIEWLSIKLNQSFTVHSAGLGREDWSRDNLWKAQVNIVPESSEWEEQAEWIGNTDIGEEELLCWHGNFQVKAWCFLPDGHLSGGLVVARLQCRVLNSAEKIFDSKLNKWTESHVCL